MCSTRFSFDLSKAPWGIIWDSEELIPWDQQGPGQETLEWCHYPRPMDPAARGAGSGTPPGSNVTAWQGGP